jgi:hypothetical protein
MKYLYSSRTHWGFFSNPADFHRAFPQSEGRVGKRIIDEPEEFAAIPLGWQRCPHDKTAIVRKPNMKTLIAALT